MTIQPGTEPAALLVNSVKFNKADQLLFSGAIISTDEVHFQSVDTGTVDGFIYANGDLKMKTSNLTLSYDAATRALLAEIDDFVLTVNSAVATELWRRSGR